MSLLAQAIARQEGFGKQGAVPTVNHNPGDLEHAPGEMHTTSNPIGSFATDDEGWAALDRQLSIYASRGLTIAAMVAIYAPPTENDSAQYLANVCAFAQCSPQDLVSAVLARG
jgi:hypothetical protein